MPSASLSVLHRPMPSPSPILELDSITQPVVSHSIGVSRNTGMPELGLGGSSKLMGALSDTYAVYNLFPRPYHPNYLSQNWVTGRTRKHHHMSSDSVSGPPSSTVSYSSYGGDSFTASTGPTSTSSSLLQ
ncbi:hypothetical protein K503DRAFT_820366 [Rhizopogon vinicolor AM-OR11-026]|uniref:Uncharacterized protein n=1 Tax=Rhizopogon vinicolor AM-OR11-026 TaxID=1314800 RepID=A0A1B7MDD0_9AGAM|nr:hypothetical protein K503DRAFT_820366 [Rhizopogon vinicolor AM-OR11-026]